MIRTIQVVEGPCWRPDRDVVWLRGVAERGGVELGFWAVLDAVDVGGREWDVRIDDRPPDVEVDLYAWIVDGLAHDVRRILAASFVRRGDDGPAVRPAVVYDA